MKKACIFDLDGTLTDTLYSLTFSVNATLKRLGLEPITSEKCRSFVGDGAKKLVERAIRESKGFCEESILESGFRIYTEVFAVNCMKEVVLYEGVKETVEELKKRGIKLGVLSNKPHKQTVSTVQYFFGTDVFDIVKGQYDGEPKKPEKAAIQTVLNQLGVEPDEVIYVGDSEVDVRTGRAILATTLAVSWGFRDEEELMRENPTSIIQTMKEVLNYL